MAGLSAVADHIVCNVPRTRLVVRIAGIGTGLLVPLDTGGLDTGVVHLIVIGVFMAELPGVLIADELDETGEFRGGLRMVILFLGVFGHTVPVGWIHLDLFVGVFGRIRVDLFLGGELLVAGIEACDHVQAMLAILEGCTITQRVDVLQGRIVIALAAIGLGADQIHLSRTHHVDVAVGILGVRAAALGVLILARGRDTLCRIILQLQEIGGIVHHDSVGVRHDRCTVVVFVAVLDPAGVDDIRLREGFLHVDGGRLGILDEGLGDVSGSHLMLAGHGAAAAPGGPLVPVLHLGIEIVGLRGGPPVSSVLRILIVVVGLVLFGNRLAGRGSSRRVLDVKGLLETGIVDLVEQVEAIVRRDEGRTEIGVAAGAILPDDGRDALQLGRVFGSAETDQTLAVAVVVGTLAEHGIVHMLRGGLVGVVAQFTARENVGIIGIQRVFLDHGLGKEDGGIEVGGAGSFVEGAQIGLRIGSVQRTIRPAPVLGSAPVLALGTVEVHAGQQESSRILGRTAEFRGGIALGQMLIGETEVADQSLVHVCGRSTLKDIGFRQGLVRFGAEMDVSESRIQFVIDPCPAHEGFGQPLVGIDRILGEPTEGGTAADRLDGAVAGCNLRIGADGRAAGIFAQETVGCAGRRQPAGIVAVPGIA